MIAKNAASQHHENNKPQRVIFGKSMKDSLSRDLMERIYDSKMV